MMIVTSVANIIFNVNSAGVHKRTVLTMNISRVYRGFVHCVVKSGRMIDSDKTKGSAIADGNSVRGMTDLHSYVSSKFKFCEGGKMSFVRRMKRKFGREQEMEVRKENSRLNL